MPSQARGRKSLSFFVCLDQFHLLLPVVSQSRVTDLEGCFLTCSHLARSWRQRIGEKMEANQQPQEKTLQLLYIKTWLFKTKLPPRKLFLLTIHPSEDSLEDDCIENHLNLEAAAAIQVCQVAERKWLIKCDWRRGFITTSTADLGFIPGH